MALPGVISNGGELQMAGGRKSFHGWRSWSATRMASLCCHFWIQVERSFGLAWRARKELGDALARISPASLGLLTAASMEDRISPMSPTLQERSCLLPYPRPCIALHRVRVGDLRLAALSAFTE